MRKMIVAILTGMLLLFGVATASAAGSDAPTPYQATTEGVHLPAGDTFPAGGHVNVRYFDGDGIQRTAGIHFEASNNQPGGQWVGEPFIPWSAFGVGDGPRITAVPHRRAQPHEREGRAQ